MEQLHDGIQDFRGRKRFLEEAPPAASSHFNAVDETIASSQDKNGHGGITGTQFFQQFQSALYILGKRQIQEHHVGSASS